MASTLVDFYSLPPEVVHLTISAAVDVVGYRKVLRLRLVDRLFAITVLDLVLQRILDTASNEPETLPGTGHGSKCRLMKLPGWMMVRLVAMRFVTGGHDDILTRAIGEMVHRLGGESSLGEICGAAVAHLRVWGIFDIWREEGKRRQRQHGDGSNIDQTMPSGRVADLFGADDPSVGALAVLAYAGDVAGVEASLARGTSPGVISAFFGDPLANAAASGRIEIVQALLEAGARLNSFQPQLVSWRGRFGLHAIESAAQAGHQDIVEFLLDPKRGLNLDGRPAPPDGDPFDLQPAGPPVNRSASSIPTAGQLHGRMVNRYRWLGWLSLQNLFRSTLACAVGSGRLNITELLLARFGRQKVGEGDDFTYPLMLAVRRRQLPTLQYLWHMAKMGDTADRRHVLFFAAMEGNEDIMRWLCNDAKAWGAEYAAYALAYARYGLEMLLSVVTEKRRGRSRSAFETPMVLCNALRHGKVEVARRLLASGRLDPKVWSPEWSKAAQEEMYGAGGGRRHVLLSDWLLDASRCCSLCAAACYEDVSVLKWTIEQGVNVHFQDMGVWALHVAASCGNAENVHYLVAECGVDVNALLPGDERITPVWTAKAEQMVEVAALLKKLGGQDPDADDHEIFSYCSKDRWMAKMVELPKGH